MRDNRLNDGVLSKEARDMGCSSGPSPTDCAPMINDIYKSECREQTAIELLADLRARINVAAETFTRTRFAIDALAQKLEREHESAVRRAERELSELKNSER